MKKQKLTCKQIDNFLKDERKATREYRKLGLPFSKDEARHAQYFEQQKRRCK